MSQNLDFLYQSSTQTAKVGRFDIEYKSLDGKAQNDITKAYKRQDGNIMNMWIDLAVNGTVQINGQKATKDRIRKMTRPELFHLLFLIRIETYPDLPVKFEHTWISPKKDKNGDLIIKNEEVLTEKFTTEHSVPVKIENCEIKEGTGKTSFTFKHEGKPIKVDFDLVTLEMYQNAKLKSTQVHINTEMQLANFRIEDQKIDFERLGAKFVEIFREKYNEAMGDLDTTAIIRRSQLDVESETATVNLITMPNFILPSEM